MKEQNSGKAGFIKKIAPTFLIKTDSSSSSDEGHSSAALFETLRREDERVEPGTYL